MPNLQQSFFEEVNTYRKIITMLLLTFCRWCRRSLNKYLELKKQGKCLEIQSLKYQSQSQFFYIQSQFH